MYVKTGINHRDCLSKFKILLRIHRRNVRFINSKRKFAFVGTFTTLGLSYTILCIFIAP